MTHSFPTRRAADLQNVKHNHEEQTIHPAQFPEGLVARIVLATTSAGGVVLDPYMGAGTTAVVARDNGRHFLGAEMDERYHSVALRRLDGRPDQRSEEHTSELQSLMRNSSAVLCLKKK